MRQFCEVFLQMGKILMRLAAVNEIFRSIKLYLDSRECNFINRGVYMVCFFSQ